MKLEDLLLYGETSVVEFKKASREVPRDMWRTYSAFANTDGGDIILGIEENRDTSNYDDRFIISGVKDPRKIIKDFWDNVNNSNKVNINLMSDNDVRAVKYKGKDLVWITVPRADHDLRPVYINDNLLRGTFKRNNEGDYHCRESEIKAMLRDANDSGNDGMICKNYTMDDIDQDTLKTYRMQFERRNQDHVWNSCNDMEFLKNLQGYGKDRETGDEGLTAAGLLMFGKGLSVREKFSNIRMDYLDETHLIEGQRWSDRITYDGTWENNLYNFAKKVMPKLISDIKRPFRMEGIIRVDETEIDKAIREALVNVIVHSDYMTEGVLKIEKKDDRFVFTNPGTLKIPVKKIYEGGISRSRNPRIQNMLRMIGMGENIGSGFPTILRAWKNENWRVPDIHEDRETDTVVLELWTVSLMPDECSEYMYRLFGNKYEELTSEEQFILCIAYLENHVTNARLQEFIKMHPVDIGKLLNSLVENDMLIKNSRGRWTEYKINDSLKKSPSREKPIDETHTELNKTQRIIMEYVWNNGRITANEVINIARINTNAGAIKALNKLVGMHMLKRHKEGKHYVYTYEKVYET